MPEPALHASSLLIEVDVVPASVGLARGPVAGPAVVPGVAPARAEAQWVQRLDELHLLTPLRILLIIGVATLVTLAVGVVVRRLLARTFHIPGGDPARTDARKRALASTLRSALLGIVWAAAVITIVSEIGINIGAFVATATVVGGAVAFGAQTLVRDVISGFFVLAEDQYGVGDSVDLGLAAGAVEKITLRSVRLRDGDGTVWYVPHGGVARAGNLSKTTAVQLNLQVTRESKLADLHRVATALGERLTETVGALLTAPPTVVGLVDLSDDRIVYRVAAQIHAGRQEDVRRAWRALVLDAFERGDLRPPAAPTTIVRVDAGTSGSTDPVESAEPADADRTRSVTEPD
ncbi:MAG: MscS Mechanosensitive ion channel [Ilumatobacteraceae bacterium]|nr:MscS Mechanosensitive ion channel [Ilumatobacteraceae bacterium]